MDTKEAIMKLGERIRMLRRQQGLSQTELGKAIGYSLNGLAKIERGESDPKFSALVKIASALDVHTTSLFSDQPGITGRELMEQVLEEFLRRQRLEQDQER